MGQVWIGCTFGRAHGPWPNVYGLSSGFSQYGGFWWLTGYARLDHFFFLMLSFFFPLPFPLLSSLLVNLDFPVRVITFPTRFTPVFDNVQPRRHTKIVLLVVPLLSSPSSALQLPVNQATMRCTLSFPTPSLQLFTTRMPIILLAYGITEASISERHKVWPVHDLSHMGGFLAFVFSASPVRWDMHRCGVKHILPSSSLSSSPSRHRLARFVHTRPGRVSFGRPSLSHFFPSLSLQQLSPLPPHRGSSGIHLRVSLQHGRSA